MDDRGVSWDFRVVIDVGISGFLFFLFDWRNLGYMFVFFVKGKFSMRLFFIEGFIFEGFITKRLFGFLLISSMGVVVFVSVSVLVILYFLLLMVFLVFLYKDSFFFLVGLSIFLVVGWVWLSEDFDGVRSVRMFSGFILSEDKLWG